jgi:hypothetical protein
MATSAVTTTFPSPSYVLASNGPLTSIFSPPTSCIQTTTFDGSNYFIGYESGLGTDSACYPPVLTTAAPKIDGNAVTLQYYSPGLCPSGWSYAVSYNGPGVPTPVSSTSTTTTSFNNFGGYFTITLSPDNSAYLCCPIGFNVGVTTTSTGVAQGAYPECTKYAADIDAGWKLQPGWPTAKPDSADIQLFSHIAYADESHIPCKSLTVRASGIVVAWHETDTAVASQALYSLTDPNNG